MRSYDLTIASLAIDAPLKWADNVLSQHHLPGVASPGRGLARRISHPVLLLLALTRELHLTLGLGVRDAVALGRQLLSDESSGDVRRGPVHVALDRAALERMVESRLREALESAPRPRRGRPPRRNGAK